MKTNALQRRKVLSREEKQLGRAAMHVRGVLYLWTTVRSGPANRIFKHITYCLWLKNVSVIPKRIYYVFGTKFYTVLQAKLVCQKAVSNSVTQTAAFL